CPSIQRCPSACRRGRRSARPRVHCNHCPTLDLMHASHPPTADGGGADEQGRAARVVLYVRPGCHLCTAARELVAAVTGETGDAWAEVDIDSGPDSGELAGRYGELVPVVTVDGVQQGYWRIDADRV